MRADTTSSNSPVTSCFADGDRPSRRDFSSCLGPPTDAVDRWLIERHRLPALQRWEVRQAVLHGRMPDDPALKGAVRDLAGGVLRSQVKLGRGLRLACWIMLAEAALVVAIGIFLFLRFSSLAGIIPVLLGSWWAVKGTLGLRTIRCGPRRAYRLNG
jgi:hypothetical protein